MHPTIFISWERHRRTREIAAAIGAELHEHVSMRPRLIRHTSAIVWTLKILMTRRPTILLVQCPSIFLALFAIILKRFFGYVLVVDRHNVEHTFRLYTIIMRTIQRGADLVIVTNDLFKSKLEADGGEVFVLPDRVPDFIPSQNHKKSARARVVFICTFSNDEPVKEVIEASRRSTALFDLYVTGDPKRAPECLFVNLPTNVKLTGYLPEENYIALLASADLIIDLTLMPDCLVCGAYEAVALEKPLVLSDHSALRRHFPIGTVFTEPDPSSIQAALLTGLNRYDELAREMQQLKANLQRSWERLQTELMVAIESASKTRLR